MLCILCLTFSEQVIHLFDNQRINLDVSRIIVKHFWFQPNLEDPNAKIICCSCWNVLYAFHKFYEKVETAHLNLLTHKAQTTLEEKVETAHPNLLTHKAPTTLDENLKEEDESDSNILERCNDILSTADVKVELKEDVLPLYDPLIVVGKRKFPQNDFLTTNMDSDSDSEIPLATLANRGKSATNVISANRRTIESPAPQSDDPFNNDDDVSDDYETNKKKVKTKGASIDDSDYEASKPGARSRKMRKTRKSKQNINSSDKRTRTKRKTIDPTKKRELSKEFDEVIEKNMKLSCSICHVQLANFFLLRKHYHSVHNERGYATCCGRKFRKRGVLVDHIYLHLNPEYFKCDKCERILSDRRSLEGHMNTHDTSKQRIYQCEECNKSFYRKLLLDRHMYTHIPDRKFNCEDCQKLFSSGYTLRQHINNVHNSAYNKICDQCGKSIRGLEAFRRHQLEHAGVAVPLVQCEKCGVKLTNKYGLKRHMNSMHPEIKILHECKECGKIAPSLAALQRHTSYMHKCERNHKCPMCDKAFKKPGGLRVIHIFEEEGLSLNICTIIVQHFSLQPSNENANNKVICASCWKELDSFHKFYQKVEAAHSKLISTWSAATVECTDILSAAIRIAGIKQDDSDDMETLRSSEDENESEYEEYDQSDGIRQTLATDVDHVIEQHIKLSCHICKKPMGNFYMLKRHFKVVHNVSGYVMCCKLKFKRRNTLADHIYLDHHLVDLCQKCGQVTAECRDLNLHKASHATNCVSTTNVTSAVTLRFEQTVQTSTDSFYQ